MLTVWSKYLLPALIHSQILRHTTANDKLSYYVTYYQVTLTNTINKFTTYPQLLPNY